MVDWKPSAQLASLQARAKMLATIRAFFANRGVLEVETPLLAHHAVNDPNIDSISAFAAGEQRYLQTSPEFAMKRLLAAGCSSIYQICKAFRDGEQGRFHNLEFTMLEWYRLGYDHFQLIDELSELLKPLLNTAVISSLSYSEVFGDALNINPHTIDADTLLTLAHQQVEFSADQLSRDDLLDLLFSHCVQPQLQSLSFVYDYPVTQAALACASVDIHGHNIAQRFECFYQGVEIANGYNELLDAAEYCQRHEQDSRRRLELGKPAMNIDKSFVAAMQHGLPECAGVAVGLDRLQMLITEQASIADVLSFDSQGA